MFIFLPSGWSRDWAEAQFGCSWSFSIIFLEPQFNWKDRNVKMKLKKKWGGFSFWEDGIDILFLSSSHQAKLITLTIIHKTSMSRLRREASPGASRPKEWHMVLPRLRERQTGNHRCHQETPAEALSLVKGPGQEQPQDRVLSDRNLCSSHTTRSSYPPSQASGHPSVPWPPSCRTAVPPPPSECQGRQLGQASNTHILTPWCSKHPVSSQYPCIIARSRKISKCMKRDRMEMLQSFDKDLTAVVTSMPSWASNTVDRNAENRSPGKGIKASKRETEDERNPVEMSEPTIWTTEQAGQ